MRTRVSKSYKITVDRSKPVDQLINEAKLNYVNSSVTSENFPITDKGISKIDIKLINFSKATEFKEILRKVKKRNFVPISISELLAFSESFPEVQREFPIVAPGTVWKGNIDRVPVLWGGSGGRSLFLLWKSYNWLPGFRFAVTKNLAE